MTKTERFLLTIIVALAGMLAAVVISYPAEAQNARASIFEPAPLDGAKTWCWERDPWCSPLAHASVTVGFSGLAEWSGLMDGEDARWIPLAFYGAKEVYDMSRFGFDGTVPAYDYVLDFGGAVVGWWVSGLLFGDS